MSCGTARHGTLSKFSLTGTARHGTLSIFFLTGTARHRAVPCRAGRAVPCRASDFKPCLRSLKWSVLDFGDLKHDPYTQNKPTNPMFLTFGDPGIRYMR